jgi:small subunit ribosomal protein S17
MRTSTTLYVHDERNDANEGDTVRVVECRPMSRSKRWRLTDVLERAK